MESLIFVLLFPLIVPWITKLIWPHEIKWVEMLTALGVGVVVSAIVFACGMVSQTADVEVWNGEVISKTTEHVSCSHSYDCNCRTVRIPQSCSGSGTKRTCSGGGTERKCDTCYEHRFDVSWDVHSNVGNWNISRVDRQGLVPPPRWTQVNPGDPASSTHMFTNYVKAVPDSLFHANLTNTFEGKIPEYPSSIYDYYKIDRVLSVGVPVPDIGNWNQDVSNMLRKLGPQKQANAIVVFVNTADESYMHALEGKWIGGKKNDVIVVMGVTEYPKIDWVGVSSWTDKAILKVQLRDDIMALGTVDRPKIINAINSNIMKTFTRKQMKDFEYLKYQIEPPFWVLTLAIILGILASLSTSYAFYRNNNPRNSYYSPRRFK